MADSKKGMAPEPSLEQLKKQALDRAMAANGTDETGRLADGVAVDEPRATASPGSAPVDDGGYVRRAPRLVEQSDALKRSVHQGQAPWWFAGAPYGDQAAMDDRETVRRVTTPESYKKLSDSFDEFFIGWLEKGGESPGFMTRDSPVAKSYNLRNQIEEKYGEEAAQQMYDFISQKFFEPIPEESLGVKPKPSEKE